jgi:hypothetical protein
MKKTTYESTGFDNLLSMLWAVFVVSGYFYLVFWKGASVWWVLLLIVLLSAGVWSKKEVIED